jgi:hypothetical protein
MVKSELWELQLDNIKVYLNNYTLNVDKVIRWQGGFTHEGTKHGLTIITTVIINGEEKRFCIPKLVLKGNEVLPFLEVNDLK